MRFGFYLPTRGPTAQADSLTEIAVTAESLGFHSVMIADHIVIPETVNSPYPYTVKGNFVGEDEALEQLTLMTFIGARTSRLRLVSSVMILPHRNPVVTTKTLATIDMLTGGRCGWGGRRLDARGVRGPCSTDFAARGAVSNEYLEIFKKLWTEDRPSHVGTHYQFEQLKFAPKPVQNPHPPIWIGGHSAALRRVARYGDGWHPVGSTAACRYRPLRSRRNGRPFAHWQRKRAVTRMQSRSPTKHRFMIPVGHLKAANDAISRATPTQSWAISGRLPRLASTNSYSTFVRPAWRKPSNACDGSRARSCRGCPDIACGDYSYPSGLTKPPISRASSVQKSMQT